MHFKFCTVILIIKNNDTEDFWFQLWHGKGLKIKTPTIQERKDLNKLKINDLLKPSENWSHRAKPTPNLGDRKIQRTTAQIYLPEMDDAGATNW